MSEKRHLSEILDDKSAGKSSFQMAICKDDWMNMEQLSSWLKEIESWCALNGFSSKHLPATSPIMVDGREYPNQRLNVSLIEFTKNKARN